MTPTAADLANAIANLRRDVDYRYANPRNKGRIQIVDVVLPEGPVIIRRFPAGDRVARRKAKRVSISAGMIATLAEGLQPRVPLNVDAHFRSGGSTRSVLESLLVHTPQFHACYPKVQGRPSRHMVWSPREPHPNGMIGTLRIDEVEAGTARALDEIPAPLEEEVGERDFPFETPRLHTRVQAALVEIGRQLGYRCFVADNDRGVVVNGRRLDEMDGILTSAADGTVLTGFPAAADAARLLDAIWFRGGLAMPAAFEVEHSTGITSGLTRMKGIHDRLPRISGILWVVVAPDAMRAKVIREGQRDQFRELDVRFMPYTAVRDLHRLCRRRALRGTTDEFLDSFCERCLDAVVTTPSVTVPRPPAATELRLR